VSAAPKGGGRPSYEARIERIHDHAEDTRSLFLRMTEGQSLPNWLPGMFISIGIALPGELRVRPYTIASSRAAGEPFEIVFNRVPGGAGVAWLFERKTGDVLNFTGPFGAFTLDRPPEQELVFIAEGTAIAAIRPMLQRLFNQNPAHPGPVRLLYAADREEHLLYRGELEGWASAHPQFRLETIVADPAAESLYARISAEVERRWVAADSDRSRHFYVCGVGPGVLKIRDLLRGAGYERRAVRYEQW
jgi:CDP-4-dehydro-6-deoxyglucose reductase, E3